MRGTNTPLLPDNLDGLRLSLKEIFYTLQGEGPFTGRPAVFVRLSGCNLKCYFCDTDFADIGWTPELDEIVETIEAQRPQSCSMVVLTGGEPMRQNIVPLIKRLLDKGLFVQIETNGTYWLDLPEDPNLFVVCSPKTPKIDERLSRRADAFKYVIRDGACDPNDGLPLNSTQSEGVQAPVARPGAGKDVFVMPQDEFEDTAQSDANHRACIDIAMRFGYRMTIQTHKVLNIR